MPEALESYLGYYIYFWIGDGAEPVHVHVAKKQQPDATKFWITTESVELARDTLWASGRRRADFHIRR